MITWPSATPIGWGKHLPVSGADGGRQPVAACHTTTSKQAYAADITYGTNNEYGFDYLRDNMVHSVGERVQRGLNFAIVDEVDSILIDEARTPLIISGPGRRPHRPVPSGQRNSDNADPHASLSPSTR
jgi:hypothetical protein